MVTFLVILYACSTTLLTSGGPLIRPDQPAPSCRTQECLYPTLEAADYAMIDCMVGMMWSHACCLAALVFGCALTGEGGWIEGAAVAVAVAGQPRWPLLPLRCLCGH
jgi:hypothetical protein